MKKALYIILFISLFSFLFSKTVRCSYNLKLVCTDFTINSCKCVAKSAKGNFAMMRLCDAPKRATCTGDALYLNCFCG